MGCVLCPLCCCAPLALGAHHEKKNDRVGNVLLLVERAFPEIHCRRDVRCSLEHETVLDSPGVAEWHGRLVPATGVWFANPFEKKSAERPPVFLFPPPRIPHRHTCRIHPPATSVSSTTPCVATNEPTSHCPVVVGLLNPVSII